MKTKQQKTIASIMLSSIIMAGSFISCAKKDSGDDAITGLLIGIAAILNKPVLMRSTTYDLDDTVIGLSEQKLFSAALSTSQPDMTNMHELYAGVEIQINLLDLENIVKQTPLLAQFWAIASMTSSVDAGPDGLWMTEDDTIDPILGYHETTLDGGTYRLTAYEDFGVTPKEIVDYTVEGNRKVSTVSYGAGTDGIFGTEDDVPERLTRFHYDGGRMDRAEHYSGDGATFESVYRFEYDGSGRLVSMTSYDDPDMENKLNYGSYSELLWDDSGEHTTLRVNLGIQYLFFWTWQKLKLMTFDFEFNENGRLRKRIMYQPLSSTQIDVCNIYNYSGSGLLDQGNMNDSADNFSDDGETRVSRTINEIFLGVD